jgi:hypothetical protein
MIEGRAAKTELVRVVLRGDPMTVKCASVSRWEREREREKFIDNQIDD